MKKFKQILPVIFITFVWVFPAFSQTVLKHPNPDEKLKSRWNWAFDQAKNKHFKDGFWVGYSIKRLMGKNSFTGSSYDPPRKDLKTLREILATNPGKNRYENVSDVEVIKKEAEKALERIKNKKKPEKKVWKDVAFLFQFSSNKEGYSAIKGMKFSNLSLVVDLDELPLIWLGGAEDRESIAFLQKIYSQDGTQKNRERIIFAVSAHEDSKLVIPFLQEKLAGNEPADIRKKAAFWLGQRDEKEALQILAKAVKEDKSVKVREQIVFAISQMDLDESTDKLIDLAQNSNDPAVQGKAVFWLGQKNEKKALSVLKKIVRSDDSYKIREKAVFAIQQINSEEAINELIDLAKNSKSRKIREKAIFWLGQKASKKAAQALDEVVQNDSDTKIQEKAVFAISQLPNDKSVPALIEIAKTHKNPGIRKKAIFWLGQSGDKRAVDAIVSIVKGK